MNQKFVKEIISWVLVFVCAIALATFIDKVIILKVEVPTGSMEKTIMTGDRIFASRLSYLISDPKRGDIIVFPFPDDEKVDYIKRIIGLPGETIEGKNGYVYINGKKLEEKYVESTLDADFGPYVIPKNSYFMMGDNRDISEDARYWKNKFVKRSKIIGKAIFKYPDFAWLNKNVYK
jgi:signal peptidase I, bacterial type